MRYPLGLSRSRFRAWATRPTVMVYGAMLALFFLFAIVIPGYGSLNNVMNIVRLSAFLGIVAGGQTLVIISGGIDLSVGAIMSFADVIVAELSLLHMSPGIAILVTVGAGIGMGLINGLAVVFLRIPPLIMTFAVGFVIDGLALIITAGSPGGTVPALLTSLGSGSIGVVPIILVPWILYGLVIYLVMHRMVFGRYLYAIGQNRSVARMAGTPYNSVTVGVYVLSGLSATLAGLLLAGFSGVAYLGIGTPYTLEAVAAVVIGGSSILGGSGNYLGTVAGTIIFTMIQGGMTVLNISQAGRYLTEGIVIILLLLAYGRSKKLV
ncbi:MAG: ABC transporter permease [Thermaerobacter sp.]|nr:ABC transporter permease [Thermaerobacter sp.]